MNLKQIQAFVQVVRTGSVSAAAATLNTTQPAISIRLSELERSMDVALLDRSRRAIRLTPDGLAFLQKAEQIHQLTEEVLAEFGSRDAFSGRVRLGVTETVALTWLPSLVGLINTRYPKVSIELDVGLTEGVWNRLNDRDLELALLPGPVGGPNLETRPLGTIRYEWMASPSIGIHEAQLGPADLAAYPIITLSRESNLHDIIERWFKRHGARAHRIDVCNSLGVVASLTAAGLGVAMLPPSIFDDGQHLTTLTTRPSLPDLEFLAAYPRNMESPLTQAIVSMAEEISTFEKGTQAP